MKNNETVYLKVVEFILVRRSESYLTEETADGEKNVNK
jgi:hypothetical protein